MEKVAFYLLATIIFLCAAIAVTRRNVTHAAVILGTALFAVAGIFLLLHATFPFILQLILVMALAAAVWGPSGTRNNAPSASLGEQQSSRARLVGVVIALLLVVHVVFTVYWGPRLAPRGLLLLAAASPATQTLRMPEVWRSLFQNYLLPSEIVVALAFVAGVARNAIHRKDT
ncbi:MAG TPA: NADH-quinone oxidoreductase subunit J [Candidatus Saccharimonadales bacterium]|jgi:NADH:ubiquinone oxidoreductase subunit 6 (subunit J)|nr:NADH-quinone oxidoreductase subunit J [Candidatus Saccharimonadales bacterium]